MLNLVAYSPTCVLLCSRPFFEANTSMFDLAASGGVSDAVQHTASDGRDGEDGDGAERAIRRCLERRRRYQTKGHFVGLYQQDRSDQNFHKLAPQH